MYNSDFYQIEDAKEIPPVEFKKGEAPADVLNRLKAIKEKSLASQLINENKKTTNGAIIGLAAGFLIAIWQKKSKTLYSFIGMLAGAAIGYTLNTIEHYKKIDEKK